MIVSADDFDFLFEPDKVSMFVNALKASGRRRVPKSTIWRAFSEIYSDLPEGPDRRRCLMRLLRELDECEQITLPVGHGRRWDRSSTVPTPTSVALRSEDKHQPMSWRDYPWHPRLQWILDRSQLSGTQFDFLKKVQRGLVEGWFETLAPLKYRSLQLTGNEKKLISMCKTRLFGEGRLTLSMLGCDPEILPMVIERVSDSADLLVFENAAPFMLACRVMRNLRERPVGQVAYGSGHQIGKSIEYLQFLGAQVERVYYVGDLDKRGIYIAARLQRHCAVNELPSVLPATGFHHRMLEAAERLGAIHGWPDNAQPIRIGGEWVFDFISSELRQRVRTIVQSCRRIPEEVLDASDLNTCFENW